MKVLVADDSLVSARILQRMLQAWGFLVDVARDGVEAWDLLQRGETRLVIADWVMPRMDGLELCRKIRSSNLSGYIYVILLTSKGNKDDIVEGLGAGADDYVTKPFDSEELRARVNAGTRIVNLEERLREANCQIAALASTDFLTGLLNRRALLESLETEIARSIRQSSPLSVIFVDLDRFKTINDRLSHRAGDLVLQEAAGVFQRVKRPYDRLARYGGDEFVLYVPGATREQASDIASRLAAALRSHSIRLSAKESITMTASIGVSSLDSLNPQSVDRLIEEADQAMYMAKAAGGDTVRAYPKTLSVLKDGTTGLD